MSILDRFKKKPAPQQETSAGPSEEELWEKWRQNERVKEWESKGWFDLEKKMHYMLQQWEQRGELIPMIQRAKHAAIAAVQDRFKCKYFIETGTQYGNMLEAQKGNFEQLYSIELNESLWERAVERFKDDDHVEPLQGDSSTELGKLLTQIDAPAILYLDAHYSHGETSRGDKDCPIYEEFEGILKNSGGQRHVFLIDDARLFIGEKDYPTIPELQKFLDERFEDYTFENVDDIIRYYPNS